MLIAEETAHTMPAISPPQIDAAMSKLASVDDRALDYRDPLQPGFSETGEPTFRRSTMRLGVPRIKSLEADDGTASLTFSGVDSNPDTTGGVYSFRLRTPAGNIEVSATVGTVTSVPASDKYFAETGKKLMDSTLMNIRKYVDTYAEEYGNTLKVSLFTVPANTSDDGIIKLRDAFCALFFEYCSSYKYNNADETSDPAGRYLDTIDFRPYDVDRRFHVTLHARQDGIVQASDDAQPGCDWSPDGRRQAVGRRQLSMNIAFDKANRKATDLVSGMVVRWIRDDYPSERRDFWTLAWKGEEREFAVSWDTGYAKIISARPDTSYDEVIKRGDELKLWEYNIPMVASLHDKEFLDNIDVFIALFSVVARHRRPTENVHVIFRPFGVPEKYYREARLPRLDADDTERDPGGALQ